MGADIHIWAEVKIDGRWQPNPDKVFRNHWYKAEEKNKPVDDQWEAALEEFETTPPDMRNYDWFAILADVRNGRGFAGVVTGQGFDVIAQPRGLPDDVSADIFKHFHMPITSDPDLMDNEDEDDVYHTSMESALRWGNGVTIRDGKTYTPDPDMHSVSYLTIKDFDEFDWNQVTMKTGVISLDQYKALRDTNDSPEMWSGSVGGGNNITISQEEADNVLDGKVKELTRKKDFFSGEELTQPVDKWQINVVYQWSVMYKEWFENRLKDTVEPLRILSEKYEDARIVFGFDN